MYFDKSNILSFFFFSLSCNSTRAEFSVIQQFYSPSYILTLLKYRHWHTILHISVPVTLLNWQNKMTLLWKYVPVSDCSVQTELNCEKISRLSLSLNGFMSTGNESAAVWHMTQLLLMNCMNLQSGLERNYPQTGLI